MCAWCILPSVEPLDHERGSCNGNPKDVPNQPMPPAIHMPSPFAPQPNTLENLERPLQESSRAWSRRSFEGRCQCPCPQKSHTAIASRDCRLIDCASKCKASSRCIPSRQCSIALQVPAKKRRTNRRTSVQPQSLADVPSTFVPSAFLPNDEAMSPTSKRCMPYALCPLDPVHS